MNNQNQGQNQNAQIRRLKAALAAKNGTAPQGRRHHRGGRNHGRSNQGSRFAQAQGLIRENKAPHIGLERVFVFGIDSDVAAFGKTLESINASELALVGIAKDGQSAHLVTYAKGALSLEGNPKASAPVFERPGFEYFNYAQTVQQGKLSVITVVTAGIFMPESSDFFKTAVNAFAKKNTDDLRLAANPKHKSRSWVKVGNADPAPVLLRNGAMASAMLVKTDDTPMMIAFTKNMILGTTPENATKGMAWNLIGSTPYQILPRTSRAIVSKNGATYFIAKSRQGELHLITVPFKNQRVSVTPIVGKHLANGSELIGRVGDAVVIARNSRQAKQVDIDLRPLATVVAGTMLAETAQHQQTH
ncbi:MAG: hypothetical protein V4674_03750 [Patescibacteria group bacterium]